MAKLNPKFMKVGNLYLDLGNADGYKILDRVDRFPIEVIINGVLYDIGEVCKTREEAEKRVIELSNLADK